MDFFHPAMTPFTFAILLMLVIMALELVGLMLGGGVSDILDSALPDLDADIDLDIDAELDGPDIPDAASAGFLVQFLSWLSVGKVPVLMLLVIFLTGFGLSGLIGQTAVQNTTGLYVPAVIMTVPAFFAALFATRYGGLGLARIIPKEETDAVSSDTFVGQVAEILRGEAKIGTPAEAKLKDIKGMTHYVLVEPDDEGEVFKAGETVLLVAKRGAVFAAIANTNTALARA